MTIIPRLAAAIATCFCISGFASPLIVSTWGGSHGDVVTSEVLNPFSASFNISIQNTPRSYSGGEHLPVPGVVELSLSEAINACDNGDILMLPLDKLSGVATDQSAIHDFVPNTLQPCAIGHSMWSTVVAYDANRFSVSEKPHFIADFFDVDTYPGMRAIRQSPRVLAEWALVASGIAPSEVYFSLDNIQQSWALIDQKLRMIEEHITWVESDIEAIELMQSGRATFAMLGSESLVRNSMHGSVQFEVLWDAAVTEMSLWAIPSDAENPEVSWEFMQYAASVNVSSRVASFFGYGPVRHSSLKLMDQRYRKMLPSWSGNRHNLVWGNSRWWQEESGFITQKFTDWTLSLKGRGALALATVSEELTGHEGYFVDSFVDSFVGSGAEGLLSPAASSTVLGKLVN